MTFAQKVATHRKELGLTQTELGEKVGVSLRTITSYERGVKKPRVNTLNKLAAALGVSVKYLSDINCNDPKENIERDPYYEEIRKSYGAGGVKDVDSLLEANSTLFAGGELSQEQKDAFFEAIMKSYIMCKEAAKEKFTPNSKKSAK